MLFPLSLPQLLQVCLVIFPWWLWGPSTRRSSQPRPPPGKPTLGSFLLQLRAPPLLPLCLLCGPGSGASHRHLGQQEMVSPHLLSLQRDQAVSAGQSSPQQKFRPRNDRKPILSQAQKNQGGGHAGGGAGGGGCQLYPQVTMATPSAVRVPSCGWVRPSGPLLVLCTPSQPPGCRYPQGRGCRKRTLPRLSLGRPWPSSPGHADHTPQHPRRLPG